MNKTPAIFFWVPALVLSGAVLLIGIVARPPKFTARTTFAIDWNSMPSVPNDEQADNVRSTWRKQLSSDVANLPSSDDVMAAILQRVNESDNSSRKGSTVNSALQRRAKVKLVKHTADNDEFSIEVQSDDPTFAQAVTDGVLEEINSEVNAEARTAGVLAAGRSYANGEDIAQDKANLKAERQNLLGRHTPEARQRLQVIEQALTELEGDHIVAGFGLLANVFGALGVDPVKVIEKTHVENRKAGYGRGLLLTAAILGCMAGIGGLATRRFMQNKSATKWTPSSVPPVINAPPLAPLQPPIIGRANL